MPILTACYLALALAVMLLLTDRLRLLPFLAVTLVTAAFGFIIGMSVSQIGNLFSAGFSLTMQSLGLVVLAGSMMSVLVEQSGAADRLSGRSPHRKLLAQLVTLVGTLAGIASTPAAALAVLTPLIRSLGRNRADGGNRLTIFLSLALSAGHGLLFPAPAVIAGLAILGATTTIAFWIGLPMAILIAIVGALSSSVLLKLFAGAHLAAGDQWQLKSQQPISVPAAGRVAVALVIASLLLVVLLAIQSLADIPSEPLGGGHAREMLIGLGRPLVLIILGPCVLMLALNRWSPDVISTEGWLGRSLTQAAPTLLLIGAAGGFQRLLQETGMAPLLGERLLTWHIGLLLPFVVAAVLKLLQGSSLVAAITAAGMIQPLLASLGLDHDMGKVLAVLAIGIGSMTISHVNDPYFWLISEQSRLRPSHSFAVVSLSMLIQGIAAILLLQLILLIVSII